MPELPRTSIDFVAGGPSLWLAEWEVETWRLPHRFAVVQDTYRADRVDLYRDKAVWLRLFQFAREFADGSAVTIVDRQPNAGSRITERDEQAFEAYFAARETVTDEDWDAPERIIARKDGALELVVLTEYWANVGGPDLYHDSMTYSIFSKEDIAERVMKFMAQANAAKGWKLAQHATPAPVPRPRSTIRRFFSWLRRHA